MRIITLMPIRFVLLLSFVCVSVGCSMPQTFYSLDKVYTQDGKPQVLIHKGRTWFSFLRLEEDSRNYLADFNLTSEGGNAQVVNAMHLADDGSDEQSTFTFVNGTSNLIQLQDDRDSGGFVPWNTTAYVLDIKTRSRNRLASVCLVGRDPQRGVCAVTRSGSRLLAVDAKQAVLYDPAQKKAIGRESDTLVELRRLIVENRGNPGHWFLTADMKYVVIAPPSETETQTGTTSDSRPIPINIAGTTIDINQNGLIFERETGKLSVFPRELDSYTVADVENVNGELQFVYTRAGYARLTDSTGKLLAEHSIPVPSIVDGKTAFAGWDPYREEFWFRSVSGQHILNYTFPQTQAEHSIICWNSKTNEERRYRITGAQIAEAIAKVPWWQ